MTGTKDFVLEEKGGVRGVNGIPKPRLKKTIRQWFCLVANFTELTEDSDRDGMKDWFEYQVQDLSLEKGDPDGMVYCPGT